MDLDDAREKVMEAPDVPGVSDVVLKLLVLVGQLDQSLAATAQRVGDLETSVAEMRSLIRAGLRP